MNEVVEFPGKREVIELEHVLGYEIHFIYGDDGLAGIRYVLLNDGSSRTGGKEMIRDFCYWLLMLSKQITFEEYAEKCHPLVSERQPDGSFKPKQY